MGTLERLIHEARELSTEEQQTLIKALSREAKRTEPSARAEAIRRVRGSMRGVLPGTAEFLAEKHADLNREER